MKILSKYIKYLWGCFISLVVRIYSLLKKSFGLLFKYIIQKKIFILNIFFTLTSILLSLIAILIAYPEYDENSKNNAIPDINGQWELEFETLESSYNSYVGDTNTYNVFFIGDKNSYKFKGERVKVNGESISFDLRDRFEGDVIIDDGSLYVLYDLYGERKTDGNFQGVFNEEFISFSGTFIGNAAETKGRVIGKRK